MPEFEYRSTVDASAAELYRYHCNPGALTRLTPPGEKVSVLETDEGISEGLVRTLLIGPKPFQLRWEALHEEFIEDRQFVDRQLSGPFRKWRHCHQFQPLSESQAELSDCISYEFPLKLPLGPLIRSKLQSGFRYRHRQTARDLKQVSRFPSPLFDPSVEPLRVGITGASGLLGRAISSLLSVAGHKVVPLKRAYGPSKEGTANWWPEPDLDALEGLDAIVHLAGETVAQLWTQSARERIYFSRVEGTKRLCGALARLKKPPKTLISTSATGYYEQQSQLAVDEKAEPGKDFLSQVCQDWEKATEKAEDAGIRVCHLRVGLVLSANGGYLASQLPAFRFGMGAVLGRGDHMQSVVDIDDIVGAVYHLLNRDDLSGPFNATAPQPLSQADFAEKLAKGLGRPLWMKAPEKAFRLLLREQASMLMDGVAAVPSALLESGYRFLSPTADEALKHHLSIPDHES